MLAHIIAVNFDYPRLINWFIEYDGDSRIFSHLGEEQITEPAGTFDTHKIGYLGGEPSQNIWIDKIQAKVVKVEVIKSPWSYKLSNLSIN